MFKGGIQNGTVATDARARKLDEQCKHLKDDVFTELKGIYPELTLQRKLLQSQIPGGVGACEPDGGAWFFRGVLIAVFEGKKQQAEEEKGQSIIEGKKQKAEAKTNGESIISKKKGKGN